MTDGRSLELEIEVPGDPEEVWRAIATGPGISSWYVPHTVEEREGGSATASFGPGPEMRVPGRVAVWEPPVRIVFDGGEGSEGLAFEWTVEARSGGTCIVRLVNSGFGDGEEWDHQYDGMAEGWRLFLLNLRLHLTHFAGSTATAMLPSATWSVDRKRAWSDLTGALGIPERPEVGSRVVAASEGVPPLAGEVVEVDDWRVALLLEEPAPGTGFLAVEGRPDGPTETSVWLYLYGPDGEELAARDDPRWRSWLEARVD